MKVNGTLINYYVHCKRQCYLHGNRLNLEDNSELVKVGRALHEEKNDSNNTEIEIENIKIDKLTKDYRIRRKGKLQVMEKNKTKGKSFIIELNEESERNLEHMKNEIAMLIDSDEIPPTIGKASCKKCAYYEYCYI